MNKKRTLKVSPLAYAIGILSFLITAFAPALMGPGLTDPEPIGPYLDGNLPSLPPSDDVQLVPAFPNITFNSPLTWAMHPNQEKVFVGQRDGIIYQFDRNENVDSKALFLDISDQVGVVWDGGFLGFICHPNFGVPGAQGSNYFYTYYSTRDGNGGHEPTSPGPQPCPENSVFYGGYLVLSRWEVQPGTLNVISDSELEMIKIRLYNTTHRGGGMVFGNDGFLYLTIGDQAQHRTAQEMENNLDGGVMRLDVNQDPTKSHAPIRTFPQDAGDTDEISGVGYWIPNDNPFIDPSGARMEEYYTLGHRNPHRMTKDKETGIMYIGEIGSNTHEEVNIVQPGKNYGWPVYEGLVVKNTCTNQLYSGTTHTPPLVAFPRSQANSITGGYVYRGNNIPSLYGKYICGDYGSGEEIWTVDIETGEYELLMIFTPNNIISFGEDHQGEIYILKQGSNTTLYKLANGGGSGSFPATLSQTGAFANLSTLEPAQGLIPYDLVQPFWSDNALKSRWMAIPNNGSHNTASEQIQYSEEGEWIFPTGSVLVKHFELPIDETNPSLTKRLETRLSVKAENGEFYFLTYKWREDGTDADLLATGLDENITVNTASGPVSRVWHYPSQSECLTCHNSTVGGTLGPRTRHLNKNITYPSTSITANQLVTLSHLGILNTTITDSDVGGFLTTAAIDDLSESLELRARSYLDVNCGYCHRPGTGNRGIFDARLTTPLANSYLFTNQLNESLGIPGERVIFPADINKSVAYLRAHSLDQSIMMPPLAKNLIDDAGVALLAEWINSLDPNMVIEENGLVATYYDNQDFTGTVLQRVDQEVNFQWGSGSPDPSIGPDSFSARWEGRLQAPTTGTYTIYTRTDDGVRLWVDDQLLVDVWEPQSPTEWSNTISLVAGTKVPIVMEYYEQGGGATAELRWEGPGISKSIIATQYLFLPFTEPVDQTIDFPAIADKMTTDAPFAINASASSGLPVSFEIVSGPATISANTITLNGTPGTVTVRASQSGNVDYNAATPVDRSFQVNAPAALQAEVGIVDAVGSSWQTVTLENTYTSMVVVASPVLASSSNLPAVTRVRNATGNSFQLKVQNPSDQSLSNYKVHYLVVEEGVYTQGGNGITMEAVKYNSTLTAENNNWQSETRSYQNSYTNPVVLGQVMTANDADWSVFWAMGNAVANPPSASNLGVGKNVAEDSDNTRNNETIGYIVLESGTGLLSGIPFTAALGADIVLGPDNSSTGYNYSISGLTNPTTAIVSAAAMDGGNGGWPVLFGANPVSTSGLVTVFDEDQIADTERNHTSEQVAYIAFETASAPQDQTISFPSIADKLTTDGPFAINATASSGLTVSFDIISGPATINGNTITLTGTEGTVTVEATQDGNGMYNPAAPVQQSFVVTAPVVGDGMDLELSVTAASSELIIWNNNTLTISVQNTGSVAASGIVVEVPVPSGFAFSGSTTQQGIFDAWLQQWSIATLGAGATATMTIDLFVLQDSEPAVYYTQILAASGTDDDSTPGNNAGPIPMEDDEAAITIVPPGSGPLDQTITFPAIPPVESDSPPFALSASASSGLAVSYSLVSGPASLSGGMITLNGNTGTIVVQADQAGNSQFNPAAPVQQSITVIEPGLDDQTITFPVIPDKLTTDGPFSISASASSALPVALTITSGPASLDGNTITLDGTVGTVVVRATQGGNSTYNPAPPVDRSFEVSLPAGESDIDLELSISASTLELPIWQDIVFSLTLTNNGNVTANNIKVAVPISTGFAYVGQTVPDGIYDVWFQEWQLPSLEAGQTATMDLTLFVLQNSAAVDYFVQVIAADPTDSDSAPNNNAGSVPAEDDEAVVTIVPPVNPAGLVQQPNSNEIQRPSTRWLPGLASEGMIVYTTETDLCEGGTVLEENSIDYFRQLEVYTERIQEAKEEMLQAEQQGTLRSPVVLAYPNPVNSREELRVEVAWPVQETLNVQLLDVYGKQIKAQQIRLNDYSVKFNVRLNGVSSGIYFLNITGTNQQSTQRIIIK